MTDRARATLSITGVVQGVGFRPFVARTADDADLAGRVHNTGDGRVAIAFEGSRSAVERAIERVRSDPPPLARIDDATVDWVAPEGATEFEIVASTGESGGSGAIPPDTATCEACLADVRDPDSRYADYWATSCVDCGPRYTVIEALPYDRPRTTMSAFPMCADCRAEYETPTDRRYHAQTIACPECGPTLTLRDDDWTVRERGPAAIDATAERIAAGDIVAIKGVGGTHLVCASRPTVVRRLRERSGRPAKPFALMAPDLDAIRAVATVSEREREALESIRRPIAVLDRRDDGWLAPVAPGLHTVGVMLPYAALHHRLFETLDEPLVMTSANPPGAPMAIDQAAIRALELTDASLVHDRTIANRCDDSVVRIVDGDRQFVRRSRGWVPEALPRPEGPPVLAVGAEFDATVAVAADDWVRPSQHVGDVDDPETLAAHADAVERLCTLFDVEPRVVARDAHPRFLTSERARAYADDPDWSIDRVESVQHHHAHAAGLLGESGVDRATILALDGTGYGPDGTVWGGEVLAADRDRYERVGSITAFRLPGGEAAVRQPARILASLLDDPDRIDRCLARAGLDRSAAAAIRQQAASGVNAPQTTSAGRTLDAAAALLDVCQERSYEGQPAMTLEAAAAGHEPLDYDPPLERCDGRPVLDAHAVLQWVADRRDATATGPLAATVQDAIARGLARIAVDAARERGHDHVGLTGGVAVNAAIHRRVRDVIEDAGLAFLAHDRVPPGDAGLAYGQAVVASARAE
ncbi:carbamoyltransferase HypF [Halococcoides cellulosivorans]|uniref:Carbamoyltransferase n=1 Tax=Halococcoides cellulosivorans TaxID=1679096 RepID=A0A2R4WYE3_9EURY|nr:carbamoyltransferase HypF [Halococcoides cellulosivorans]AWB26540.1 carbamoyltransferase HypF [Halococcoides cellulosivorans]